MSLANKYEFSMGVQKFNLYFVKVLQNGKIIGFFILQRKNHLLKLLFTYYVLGNEKTIARVVLSHAYQLKIREFVSYDKKINTHISRSFFSYIYKRNKVKESIISKVFNSDSYEAYQLNFGDGDCCFA